MTLELNSLYTRKVINKENIRLQKQNYYKANFFKQIGFIIIIAFFGSGCSKDDKSLSNYFQYDTDKYYLSAGALWNQGLLNVGSIQWLNGLALFTSGIKAYQSGENLDSIVGTGSMLYFSIICSDRASLTNGIYTFSTESNLGTFTCAKCDININTSNGNGTVININAGTVKVNRNGNTYTIDIDCTANTGKKIFGHFKGKLNDLNN